MIQTHPYTKETVINGKKNYNLTLNRNSLEFSYLLICNKKKSPEELSTKLSNKETGCVTISKDNELDGKLDYLEINGGCVEYKTNNPTEEETKIHNTAIDILTYSYMLNKPFLKEVEQNENPK